jgi:uncharacterized delta-60 repeat protein
VTLRFALPLLEDYGCHDINESGVAAERSGNRSVMKRLLVTVGGALFVCGCQAAASDAPEVVPEERRPGERAQAVHACPAGALDTTFGGSGTGVARISIKPDDAGGFFDLDLSGRRVTAVGWGAGGLGGSTFKVARLKPDGRPDPSFAGGSVVRTAWGSSTANYAYARGVGRQRDGRVVAVGWFERPGQSDIALARYDLQGDLDRMTFAGDGRPLIDLGGAEVVESGIVDAEDRILAAGARDGHLMVARFLPDGVLDTSFAGGTGYFTTVIGESSTAAAITQDDLGRIVVAGSAATSGQRDVLVARLRKDGELDLSFGKGGVVLAGDPAVNERAVAAAVTPTGDIVVGGDAGAAGGGADGSDRDFLVRRFREDGSPDTAFGHAGAAIPPITPGDDQAEGMALLPRGGVLVVGNTISGDARGPIVARVTDEGALDLSFGSGGVLPLDVGEYGLIHTVGIDPGGAALIGGGDEGASPGPGTYLVVARLCL